MIKEEIDYITKLSNQKDLENKLEEEINARISLEKRVSILENLLGGVKNKFSFDIDDYTKKDKTLKSSLFNDRIENKMNTLYNNKDEEFVDHIFYEIGEATEKGYVKFMSLVQSFSEEQIDLDRDFMEALEELTIISGRREPSKTRF